MQRAVRAQYLVVHVVQVQGLPKSCFHFLLHVFVAHGTDKRNNPGRKESQCLTPEIHCIMQSNHRAEPLKPHLNGLLSSTSKQGTFQIWIYMDYFNKELLISGSFPYSLSKCNIQLEISNRIPLSLGRKESFFWIKVFHITGYKCPVHLGLKNTTCSGTDETLPQRAGLWAPINKLVTRQK